MIPSSQELVYFLEVAQTHNMSRAAERLGVTQPALTFAIRRLEDSLGQKVFLRSKSGVTLTRSGEKLVLQARHLLDEWNKVTSEVSKDTEEVKGRYTLGCHPSVALYTLPGFLPKLLSENPGLEINLVHDLSRRITEDVVSFKIDFGIVINPVPHPDLVLKLLLTDHVSFWSRACDFNKDILIYDPDLIQSQQLLRLLLKTEIKFKRILTSSNLEVICQLVMSGAGVGILPNRVATRIKSGKLKIVDKSLPRFEDKLFLAYRADAQKSRAGKIISEKIQSL